jgi:hypothetical protein
MENCSCGWLLRHINTSGAILHLSTKLQHHGTQEVRQSESLSLRATYIDGIRSRKRHVFSCMAASLILISAIVVTRARLRGKFSHRVYNISGNGRLLARL